MKTGFVTGAGPGPGRAISEYGARKGVALSTDFADDGMAAGSERLRRAGPSNPKTRKRP